MPKNLKTVKPKGALIDTNLIIRFLLNDDPDKATKVEKLLKDKSSINFLLDTVIAEIVWVLSSYYDLSKTEVIEKISALIHVETVECNTKLVSRTLAIWQNYNISYIDSYLAAVAELGDLAVYTYDRKFKSIPSITTREP